MKAKNSHKGTMFGIPLSALLTYTNVAYLFSLLVTFILTVSLWRVSVAAQNESELQLAKYKSEAAARVAEANARAEVAHAEAAKALAAAAQAGVRAAEAEARAASANLEVTRIKMPRSLDTGTRNQIIEAARQYPGTCFASGVALGNGEATSYLEQIEAALIEAGWIQQNWTDMSGLIMNRPDRPQTGQFAGEGAAVVYHEAAPQPIADASRSVSTAMGISPLFGLVVAENVIGPRTDCARLIVGSKKL